VIQRTREQLRQVIAVVAAVVVGGGIALAGSGTAVAATNPPNAPLYGAQTFYVYAKAGELPKYTFTRTASTTVPVTITITDPEGDVQQQCVHPGFPAPAPVGTACVSTGLTASTAGIWTIAYDPHTVSPSGRYTWDVTVVDALGTPIPGRTWVENYELAQGNTARTVFSLWIATREGYGYAATFYGYGGIISGIASNGFGLVQPGTCTPLYRSAQLSDPAIGFSDACGERYKLFLEAPAADLPESATLPDGTTEWVRPAVVPPAATNLTLTQTGPFSRAGDLEFDLTGVNGGYSVQLDTNANGVFTDPVDRMIPWGSPPGHVAVPFDGLNGLGNPLSVCAPLNAKVVVDRVGETHLVMNDVEAFWTSGLKGLSIVGATPGVVGANPKLYWNDTSLAGGGAPLPFADGRAGVDTSAGAAHGWMSWGDNRAIENWTYYQAQAGAQVTIPSACDAALDLEKDGELNDTNGNGLADVGESVDYTFTVSNSGNAPVTGVVVDDDRVAGITPASANIAVFGEQTFTAASYVVTQEDVDAGGVPNVASAAGTDPLGDDVISNEATHFIPTVERAPELELDKQATLDDTNDNGLADAGETIAYTFEVTNTGNVTIDDVAVADPRVTGLSPASAHLAPGESQTFTAAPYVVTQADIAIGSVDNSAVANGTSPTGPVQSNTDATTTPTPQPNPLLGLDKSATITGDADSDGLADVGDTITYTFEVSNTGNLDVSDVSIADPQVAATTPVSQDIPAGQSRTFTATYVAVQGDVDFGSIPNTAVASGTYEGAEGPTPIESAPDTAVVATPERAPSLMLEKDGTLNDTNSNGRADVGETIDYTFTVTNDGNVTLENVTVFDDRVASVSPAPATLAPGDDQVFTATGYVVTQKDVDTGEVLNTAYARGNIPGGAEALSETDDHVVLAVEASPALTIDKIATLSDENGNGTADAGEQISYAFIVTNTGNVTLTDVTVVDDRIAGLIPEAIDFLPPGAPFTFEAEAYEVMAADMQAATIVNTASATGLDPGLSTVTSADDTATVPVTVPATPAAELGATGANSAPLLIAAGVAMLAGLALVGARTLRRRRASEVQ
jgi:uncharacterized repeat protein (TIGR01451 family)